MQRTFIKKNKKKQIAVELNKCSCKFYAASFFQEGTRHLEGLMFFFRNWMVTYSVRFYN